MRKNEKKKLPRYFSTLFLIAFVFLTSIRTADAFSLWGTTTPNSIYLGMWSLHLRPSDQRSNNYVNNLIGFSYHSLFFGTFENSFGKQAFAAGFQRNLYTHQFQNHPDVNYSFGYRIGGVTGYDKRLMHLAGETPVIPFGQLVWDLSYKHLGWEVTYTGVVISTGFYILI